MPVTRILHIAPMNTAGVPGQFVQAERVLGFDSRLVTLYRGRQGYFQDICLDLPFIDFSPVRVLKRLVSSPRMQHIHNKLTVPDRIPPRWQPHSSLEAALVRLRDRLWWPRIRRAIRDHGLEDFHVLQLDGGLDFTRRPRFVPTMKARGAKVICCYTGSDLRTRGVIEEIDRLCDTVVSVEFDHQMFHPRLQHVFFPFSAASFSIRKIRAPGPLRIGHAPTNWSAKGSHVIVPVMQELADRFKWEVVLIQNLTYPQALELKRRCDIFVDQIGDLGYGINSLEALAMGIPACSCLAPGFAQAYPDHPFVIIDEDNLADQLLRLADDAALRRSLGERGRAWVQQNHDPVKVVQQIHALAGLA